MKISREDVLRVAELAYLDLSEAELETYRAQIDEILEYIGKLNELTPLWRLEGHFKPGHIRRSF